MVRLVLVMWRPDANYKKYSLRFSVAVAQEDIARRQHALHYAFDLEIFHRNKGLPGPYIWLVGSAHLLWEQ